MAFPDIPTVAGGRALTGIQADTLQTRTFPSLSSLTKNANDLLIALITGYQSSSGAPVFGTWGAGFTSFINYGLATTQCFGAAYKWSTGSETGTFTVTQANTITGHAAMILLSIPGAHTTSAPEAPVGYGTSSGTPPSVGAFDPSGWAAEDSLWIVFDGTGETATGGSFTGLSAGPTNYSGDILTAISADVVGGVQLGVSFRQLNAASETPGAWSGDSTNVRHIASVIAVRPAPTPPGPVLMPPQRRAAQRFMTVR